MRREDFPDRAVEVTLEVILEAEEAVGTVGATPVDQVDV